MPYQLLCYLFTYAEAQLDTNVMWRDVFINITRNIIKQKSFEFQKRNYNKCLWLLSDNKFWDFKNDLSFSDDFFLFATWNLIQFCPSESRFEFDLSDVLL